MAIEPCGPPFEERVIKTGPSRPWGITYTPVTYDPPVEDPESELKRERRTFSAPSSSPLSQASGDNTDGEGETKTTVDYFLQGEPARNLVNLANIPILVITSGSSYHAGYDQATVAYLRQAGVRKVEHLELEKEGMRGNGHFCFMERNNDEIARRVEKWIDDILG